MTTERKERIEKQIEKHRKAIRNGSDVNYHSRAILNLNAILQQEDSFSQTVGNYADKINK